MSIHGIQIRFPGAINKKNNQEIPINAVISANLWTILNRLEEGEKITSFAQIVWPFIFIQGEVNKHLMIDDTGISKLKEKILNSPRTAQIGHILRQKDYTFEEKLKIILDILKFKKVIVENGDNESAQGGEFINVEIKGLVEPKILDAIKKIIGFSKNFNMNEMESLESMFSFDDALEYAEKYRNLLEQIKGTRQQWESLIELIEEPVERELLNIKVEKKDIMDRYNALIAKSKTLDESTIREELNKAKDFADQWMVRRHKEILQNIAKQFILIDLECSEMLKRNKFFTNIDLMAKEPVGKMIQRSFKHIAELRNKIGDMDKKLDEISAAMNKIREELRETNLSVDQRINNISIELLNKKELQEHRIQQLISERNLHIETLNSREQEINELWQRIRDIIDDKVNGCNYDLMQLQKWQLDDAQTDLKTPTVRYFLPIGIAVIEDEDEEERIEIALPAYFGEELKREPITKAFQKFERDVIKLLDRNMKIRSNFEFACERGNILKDETKEEVILKGLEQLKMYKLINNEIEEKIKNI